MKELILELIEINLRRAGVAEEKLQRILTDCRNNRSECSQFSRWLTERSITDDTLDDYPLEWE